MAGSNLPAVIPPELLETEPLDPRMVQPPEAFPGPEFQPEIPQYLPPEPPSPWARTVSPFASTAGVAAMMRRGAPGGAFLLAGILQGMAQQAQRQEAIKEEQRQEMNRRFESAAAYRNRANLAASGRRDAARLSSMNAAQQRAQAKADREQQARMITPQAAKDFGLSVDWIGKSIDQLQPELRAKIAQRAPRDERLVQIMGPSGTPVWVLESEARGKPAAQAARAVTGIERTALAYYNRAKDAGETADALEKVVTGAGVVGQLQLRYAPNMLQTSDQQRYRQAQRAFTEARLRKESGAAIPMHEYENDSKTYFAQPGDDPATIEQKRLKRQTVLDGLAYSAGRAYEEYYGEPMNKRGGGTVRMVAPDGRILNVPRDKVAEAEKRGARRQ